MIETRYSQAVHPSLDELPPEDFLLVVGQRVRKQRARKSMSRKRLAEVSGVSERYLAQLESGQGNMSIALLRKVTTAIGMSLGMLMSAEVTEACVQRKVKPLNGVSAAPQAVARTEVEPRAPLYTEQLAGA